MTESDLAMLNVGDLVQHARGDAYVVIARHGGRAIAVREIEVSNPSEWTKVFRNEVSDRPTIRPFSATAIG